MGAMQQIGIIDYRSQLARANWSIGWRNGTRYATIHYNGPAVYDYGYPAGELAHIRFVAEYHMRPDAFGEGYSGDGIQYHYAALSDGSLYQLRDWNAELWHCGNAEGNNYSFAIYSALGDNQQATMAHQNALTRLLDAMRVDYGIDVSSVHFHGEWKQTACAGSFLNGYVHAYRDAGSQPQPPTTPDEMLWYKTIYNANCRQAPDTNSPIVMVTPVNTTFGVDAIITDGASYQGSTTYVHRADHLGFYHSSVVAPA